MILTNIIIRFPGGHEPSREDPREIYIKLGSRPPRDQSYYGS
jgi:hypothetical protein